MFAELESASPELVRRLLPEHWTKLGVKKFRLSLVESFFFQFSWCGQWLEFKTINKNHFSFKAAVCAWSARFCGDLKRQGKSKDSFCSKQSWIISDTTNGHLIIDRRHEGVEQEKGSFFSSQFSVALPLTISWTYVASLYNPNKILLFIVLL